MIQKIEIEINGNSKKEIIEIQELILSIINNIPLDKQLKLARKIKEKPNFLQKAIKWI